MSEKKKEIEVKTKQAIDRSDGEPTQSGVFFEPDVNIYETEEAITLVADMPGVASSDLDIDLRDRVLTLTATVRPPEARFRPVYREYQIGGFSRRFTLGDAIDQKRISAEIKNGVLTLALPKAEKLKPRKIEIKTA